MPTTFDPFAETAPAKTAWMCDYCGTTNPSFGNHGGTKSPNQELCWDKPGTRTAAASDCDVCNEEGGGHREWCPENDDQTPASQPEKVEPVSASTEPENKPQKANGGHVAQKWVNALAGAKTTVNGRDGKPKQLTWAEKALGMVIANHAHWTKGTVFIGFEKLMSITGADERNVKGRRAALKAHGWLVETGDYQMGCKVYRLTIPE